jgi:hypothetical protein
VAAKVVVVTAKLSQEESKGRERFFDLSIFDHFLQAIENWRSVRVLGEDCLDATEVVEVKLCKVGVELIFLELSHDTVTVYSGELGNLEFKLVIVTEADEVAKGFDMGQGFASLKASLNVCGEQHNVGLVVFGCFGIKRHGAADLVEEMRKLLLL